MNCQPLLVILLLLVNSCAAQDLSTETTAIAQSDHTDDGNSTVPSTTSDDSDIDDGKPDGEWSIPGGVNFVLDKLNANGVDWYVPAKWFVELITPKELPLEFVKRLLDAPDLGKSAKTKVTGESSDNKKADVLQDSLEILKAESAFLFFVGFGLAMAILVPFCGLISLCCLCCSSKNVPRPSKKTRKSKTQLLVVLSFLLIIILVGIIYMFAAGTVLSQAFDNSRDKLIGSIDDTNTLFNNTEKQINYIVGDGFSVTLDKIKASLSAIDKEYGAPIIKNINDSEELKLANLLEKLTNSSKELDETSYLVKNLIVLSDDLQQFEKNITDLKNNINCNNAPSPLDCFSNLNSLDITTPKQTSLNNDTVDGILKLRDTLDEIHWSIQNSTDSFPQTVKDETKDVRKNIIKKTKEFQSTVQSMIEDFSVTTASIYEETGNFKSTIDSSYNGEVVKNLKKYLFNVVTGLSCILFVAWFLYLMGLCGGGMFYQKHKLPQERSCSSSCSGCLLILGTTLVFLFSLIFWLLCTLLFFAGGHIDVYVCKPLHGEPEFVTLKEYIGMMNKDKNGSVLGNLVFGNSSIKLELSDVLNSCEKNETVYTALQLHHLFNLEDKMNYADKIDEEEMLADIKNQVNVEEMLFPNAKDINHNETFESFQHLDEFNVEKIFPNIPEFQEALKQLEQIDPTASSLSIKLSELEERLKLLDGNMSKINGGEHSIQRNIRDTQQSVNNTIKNLPDVINPILDKQTGIYIENILNHVDNYVKFVNSSIYNDVGNCYPVWNVFVSIRGAICDDVIYPINGYWFGFGWALFFFLPTMLFGVKFSRHLRRMKCKNAVIYAGAQQIPLAQYQ